MNKWILILALVVVVMVVWASRPGSKNDAYRTVGVDEFEQLIADTARVVLLDVRSASEYAEAHLRGALLIDVRSSSFRAAALKQLPKDKTVAVYCRSGRRSATAAGMLAAEGFQVVNLNGGILGWEQAGKETVR